MNFDYGPQKGPFLFVVETACIVMRPCASCSRPLASAANLFDRRVYKKFTPKLDASGHLGSRCFWLRKEH
ncbi:MAG TPA: hypothetical protein VLI90_02125, partial [Tepidisphaeraceae bacterium]|nr:hypothetical protein [Tepidisphaeraceae bacterium]